MPNIAALVTVAAVMYYVENSNPAIVSRETYDAVQALIKSRQPSCKRKAKNYPLTRTLLCPDCGHTFRRQVVNGTAYVLRRSFCAAYMVMSGHCSSWSSGLWPRAMRFSCSFFSRFLSIWIPPGRDLGTELSRNTRLM